MTWMRRKIQNVQHQRVLERIDLNLMRLVHVSGSEIVADGFTKPKQEGGLSDLERFGSGETSH